MNNSNDSSQLRMPKARKEVEELTPYSAPLEGRRNLLRLDFNENTIGPSPRVLNAIKSIPNDHISVYPEYAGLREQLILNLSKQKSSIKLTELEIGIFNGVDAAIHAIFHSFGDKNDILVTTNPTFGYYAPCAKIQGMQIISIPYKGSQFNFPLKEIKDLLEKKKTKILMICNPNNPTGTILEAKEIIQIANSYKETLVVVDELYEAFNNSTILPEVNLKNQPNLIILRSLSKTAGLAGLRIGFAIGNPKVVNLIQRVTGPYDINTIAVKAGIAALKDQEYIDSYVKKVLEAKDWLREQMVNQKIQHHIGGGNYFLIWPGRSPEKVESYLQKNGILVRNMAGKELIDGSLRVSIGTIQQMQRFWEVYKKI